MGKHLERRLRNELAARTRITNALIRWYDSLSISEQERGMGGRIVREAEAARKKELRVQDRLRMYLDRKKH